MKLPRDVSSKELVSLLKRLGFKVTRQRGSHIRLEYNGQHITVPAHNQIKPGLLHAILKSVSEITEIEMEKLYEML